MPNKNDRPRIAHRDLTETNVLRTRSKMDRFLDTASSLRIEGLSLTERIEILYDSIIEAVGDGMFEACALCFALALDELSSTSGRLDIAS